MTEKSSNGACAHDPGGLSVVNDNLDDVVFRLDVAPDGYRVAYVNEAFCRLTGLPREQVIGQRVEAVIPESSRPVHLGKYAEALRERRTMRWTERAVFPVGERHGRISVRPVFDASGRAAHLVGSVHDVTPEWRHERELERLNRLYSALSQVNQAIVMIAEREPLFERICQVLVEQGGFRMAWIGWHDPETRLIEPVASWGDEQAYLSNIRVRADGPPSGIGPTATAYLRGRNYVCNDMLNDALTLPWRAQIVRQGLRSSSAYPIRLLGIVRGTLNVYSDELGFFQEREVALLQEVAADISFALDKIAGMQERQRAEAEIKEYAERLQAASRLLLDVQENERRAISRELHDTVGQELTALSINLAMVRTSLPADVGERLHKTLDDSEALLEESTRHLRDVMVALRPPAIDEFGLLAALRDHAGRAAHRSALAVHVEGAEPEPRLPPSTAIALFRIAQEALNNAIKHAQASRVVIELREGAGSVRLTVSDNGVGIDASRRAQAPRGGMGMTTMRERAEALGTRLQVESAPGAGTRITVDFRRRRE